VSEQDRTPTAAARSADAAAGARPPDAAPDRDSLWCNGDFMRLWGGETLSQVGSQISTIALPLTAITLLHAGPGTVGLLTTAQYAPVLLVSPFAGHWFDTHRCRPALVAANLGRALLIGLVPLAYLLDVLTVPLLLLVAFATGALSAVFDIGYITYLPKLVKPGQLTAANARLESTYSIAGAGGPGLGGVLVQALGAPGAVLADAVSYLVAGVLGLGIRHREDESPRPARSPWPAVREGMSFLMRHEVLRPMLAQSAAFNLLGQVTFTLFLLYGVENLHLSSGVLGVVLSVSCLGGLLGAALAARTARSLGEGRAIVWSMAVGSFSLAAIPAASGPATVVVATLVAGLILHELGLGVFNVHSLTVRARLIPPELLGRATASWRLVSTGGLALNGVVAGALGELLGVRTALVVATAVLAVCCVLFCFSSVRTVPAGDEPDHGGEDGRN
jgi:MFS family permease